MLLWKLLLPACLLLVVSASTSASAAGSDGAPEPTHLQACEDGLAGGFPCHNVDLLERFSNSALGASSGNDSWGWTDPLTGREYALMGLNNGTSFIDITDPEASVLLGKLPTHSGNSVWRDIKVYANHAFIVAEATNHGMQVFDLTQLRGLSGPPVTFSETAFYGQFGRAHNIVIDEQSGYAYAVGSRQGTQSCNAGLHMIDIRNPQLPTFAGCFSTDGYTHDAQCTVYTGPDTTHQGKQICFAANEDTITIVDVTNKASPVQLSRTGYAGAGYTHQGWLTEDQRFLLVDDETDEINFGHNTRTYIFDVSDLDVPVLHMTYTANNPASDHNLYVKGNYAFQANYRSGLRILDISAIGARDVSETAFFDTTPASDASGTEGAWNVYPYFPSGTVIVSDFSAGLFVLRPNLCSTLAVPQAPSAMAAGANQIQLGWTAPAPGNSIEVLRSLDGCDGPQTLIAQDQTGISFVDSNVSGGVNYGYRIRTRSSAQCASTVSACVVAQTTGVCTAPPMFAGIINASSTNTAVCGVQLNWNAATPRCAGPAQYRVQRSNGVVFDALNAVTLASAQTATSLLDASVESGQSYAYRVRSLDAGNNSEDDNEAVLTARAVGPVADGDFATGAEIGDPLLGAPSGRHVAWETISTLAHTGQRSYFSGYDNNQCIALESAPLTITSGQSASLSFFTRYGLEAGWDGGVVQISTDNGANWQTVAPAGGYPSSFNASSADACNLPNSSGAFTGSALTWTGYNVDLSSLSGTIRFRFLFSTDGGSTAQGWWLDDVRLTHVQVPGMCTVGPGTLFEDGFE
jgi:choice-of-anchor B domain-containing protein